jgi:hypothetical protein
MQQLEGYLQIQHAHDEHSLFVESTTIQCVQDKVLAWLSLIPYSERVIRQIIPNPTKNAYELDAVEWYNLVRIGIEQDCLQLKPTICACACALPDVRSDQRELLAYLAQLCDSALLESLDWAM